MDPPKRFNDASTMSDTSNYLAETGKRNVNSKDEQTDSDDSQFSAKSNPSIGNRKKIRKPDWPKGKPRKPPINKQPNDDTLNPIPPRQAEVISLDKEDPSPGKE
ncbi:hypothetical protein JTB14_026381 [Gonioctena quinquepunctata]|nr:hypothetical protein JTB14_026381 [Gonioctena quinquepunctata]